MTDIRLLDELREKIETLDARMMALLETRLKIVRELSMIKRENAMSIFDKSREEQLLANTIEHLEEPANAKYCEMFLHAVTDVSRKLQSDLRNVYLIGMPMSGKSATVKQLEQIIGIPSIDMDEKIVSVVGMSVREIFDAKGEECFRQYEHDLLKAVAKHGSMLVSTGGGILTNVENIAILHASGVCVYLDKPLERLLDEVGAANDLSRPLIKCADDMMKIYYERMVDYRKHADKIINPCAPNALEELSRYIESVFL